MKANYVLEKEFNEHAYYWRQVTFWKDKEVNRPTRGEQMLSLAARFARFEKIAARAKEGLLIPTQTGFEPKKPIRVYGRFPDYELILKKRIAQLVELAQPPLSRQPILPFGRLQVEPGHKSDLRPSTLHHFITFTSRLK